MTKSPEIPMIKECIDLVEFAYCDAAVEYTRSGDYMCGENETIEKELVGPISYEDGSYFWGVLVYVTRMYPPDAMNSLDNSRE